MNYPVITALQLRSVLRAMRQARGLSQARVGELLGVNQKRIAAIERAPGVTGFDQIARLVAALGGRVVIESAEARPADTATGAKRRVHRETAAPAKAQPQGDW